MAWFDNINKPPMTGFVSGREALGLAKSGGPTQCQSCLRRPARVRVTVKGKPFRVCFDCAPDEMSTSAAGGKKGKRAKRAK